MKMYGNIITQRMIKKISLLMLIITFHLFSGCTRASETKIIDAVIVVDSHFEYILYDGLPESILIPIQRKLNDNYSRVLNDLEVTNMNKVTVKIWGNETNFLDDMEQTLGRRYIGSSGWVGSSTDIRILNRGNATAQIALHEFCHAVSLVVNNQIGNNPRWLWEAVAIYEAGEFRDPKTLSYLINGNFPTIEDLNANFTTSGNKIYEVGYLLSEFIITRWGKSFYLNLIKSNGNISQILGLSTLQFEEAWKVFVMNKYFQT